MRHKIARYQLTFVMGNGDKGEKVDKILRDQTGRVAKLLGQSKPSLQATLRVALRTMANLKDKDLDLAEENN